MTRVLFVLDSLGLGGAEKELITLLAALPTKDLSIDLYLASARGELLDDVPAGVSVFEAAVAPRGLIKRLMTAGLLRLNELLGRPVHPAQLSWRFLSSNYQALREDYDVAIAYSQGFPTFFVATHVNARKKVAWVNTDYRSAGYRPRLDVGSYEKFDNIVCVSETALKIFEAQHPQTAEKLVMIRSFVDANEVRSLGGDESPFGSSVFFNITTVGRLSQPKGLDILIDAATHLASSGLRFKWHVVGDGGLRSWLEAQVVEKGLVDFVVLHGAQSNPFPFMKFCDVYCQPSRFEGFARTVLEARAFATPIVVTDFQSARDQISDGENGLVVEANGAAVADALARLASDPALCVQLSETSKRMPSDTMHGIEEVLALFQLKRWHAL